MIREVLSGNKNLPRSKIINAHPKRLFTAKHIHTEAEILYVTSGNMTLYTEIETTVLYAGDFVFINENIPHATLSSHDNIYINIQYNFSKVLDESDSVSIIYSYRHKILRKSSPLYEKFREIILRIMQHDEIKDNYPEYLKGDFYYLLNYMTEANMLFSTQNPDNNKKKNKLHSVVEYINKNFRKDISLEELSDKFSINPSYLCRMFKNHTNYTVVEYINYVRIMYAEQLISNTSKPFSEISKAAGFASQSYFNKNFRKYLLVTPMNYRRFKTDKKNTYNFYYIFDAKGDPRL